MYFHQGRNMRTLMFSTRSYEPERYQRHNHDQHNLEMVPDRLTEESAKKARGFEAILVFVSDDLSAKVLEILTTVDVKLVICRSAGVDHVDLVAAQSLGLAVANCPEYSPSAVAEFGVGLLLALNRKIVLAHEQIMHHDFSLDNLLGTELRCSTIGIIGTGHIGTTFARIMKGFGCTLLAYDPNENPECITLGVKYNSLETIFAQADAISLHIPLLQTTRHLINQKSIDLIKPGMLIINTARGAVVDTTSVIAGIEAGQIGGYAADVYEYERGVYFENYTHKPLNDPLLEKLLGMPQVLLTPHQAFFTETALENIASNVFKNLDSFSRTGKSTYSII
jgi:D-lactate dehydrogenase